MKKRIISILLAIFSIGILYFVYNDDFLYKDEIVKISKIETVYTTSSYNDLGLEEKYYTKSIIGYVTNGKNKGEYKTLKYEEAYSSVVTDKYKVHDKIIVKNNEVSGLKRDFYITLLAIVFIDLIFIVGEIKGLLSIVSVILNAIVFYIGLVLYCKGINLLFLCVIESIIFSMISLFIAGGINKKTISSILSVITCVGILLLGTVIIVKLTNYNGINFNEFNFLTVPVEDIILPELLIGGLGAIMDVAITISSSISELIEKDKYISVKNLTKSAKEIGKDIMSTMSNVLFFTYLCGGLPIFVLAVRNGFSAITYITTNFSFELTRFLIGSIGIIMTIPISTFISIKLFRRNKYE